MASCDTRSTRSFQDKNLRDQLDVPGNSITLSIAGVNEAKDMVSDKVRIKITTPSVSESVMFHVQPSMYPGNESYDYNDLNCKYNRLDVFADNNMDLKQVKVVLGQDNYHLLFPSAYRKGKRNEPWAVKTKLGWTLSGPLPKHEVTQLAATSHVAVEDDGLGAQIKTWFSMELYATRVKVSGRSRQKKSSWASRKDNKTGRWSIRSCTILGRRQCDDSEHLFLGAFAVLFFGTTSGERWVSQATIRRHYQCELAEGLRSETKRTRTAESRDEWQWYVPHHPVINPHKPEMVRRLCNAAAKYKGESLKDKLLTGPDLLQNLVGIIFRFQEHQIALTADIEAMFLEVKVPPEVCQVLRFLWRSKPEDKKSLWVYMTRLWCQNQPDVC